MTSWHKRSNQLWPQNKYYVVKVSPGDSLDGSRNEGMSGHEKDVFASPPPLSVKLQTNLITTGRVECPHYL